MTKPTDARQSHDQPKTQPSQQGQQAQPGEKGPQTQQGDDPPLQGEGNYAAARRHREAVEQFIDSGRVEQAAQDAAPQDKDEQREMQQAEEAGRTRARS